MYETCSFYLRFKDLYSVDGVAMRSPLDPLFMISLEEALLPSIKKHVAHWKRYVDETHAYIHPSKIEFVLEKLNSHYHNIQFKNEIEENQKIMFLSVKAD